MAKDREQIKNELQTFKRLSVVEQTKERKKLDDQEKAIKDHGPEIQKAIQSAEKSKKDLEDEITSAQKQLSEARGKRIKLFALDMDTAALDAEIWKLSLDLQTREAIRADGLVGLNERISDLKNEFVLLEEESAEIERMLRRFDDVPRIAKINRLLTEAFKEFEQVLENQEALNYVFHGFGVSGYRMVLVSNWDSLDHVPKLYLDGDIGPDDQIPFGQLKDIWSLRVYREIKKEKGGY